MPNIIVRYVRVVDRVNRAIGRATMYLVFVMIGVLFWSSLSKSFTTPALWTLDIAQFLMVAYFLLAGPYAIQLDGHVRMDLFYGNWKPRTKARMDTVTVLFMNFYIFMLLVGAIASTTYSIEFGEVGAGAWRPYMWPIKVVMTFAIFMMLLQGIAEFFKSLAAARGEPLE